MKPYKRKSQTIENIQKLFSTYRNTGLIAVIDKIFRYVTDWRRRRDDMFWFLKRTFINQTKLTAKVLGLKYYLYPYGQGISKELAIYHIHEPIATGLFRNYVKDSMYVVDIGSNLGYYALLAATLVGSRGKVLAIEPESNNYELLKINADANHIQNIETVHCAVSNKEGISEFYITKSLNNSSLILPPSLETTISSIQVKTRKLDNLLKELSFPKVDFIRMDIEGGEIVVIEGMQDTLKQHKPTVLAELHCDAVGTDSIVKLLKSLKTFGYNPMYIVDRDKDFAWIKNRRVQSLTSMNELLKLISNYRVATVLLR